MLESNSIRIFMVIHTVTVVDGIVCSIVDVGAPEKRLKKISIKVHNGTIIRAKFTRAMMPL